MDLTEDMEAWTIAWVLAEMICTETHARQDVVPEADQRVVILSAWEWAPKVDLLTCITTLLAVAEKWEDLRAVADVLRAVCPEAQDATHTAIDQRLWEIAMTAPERQNFSKK